MNQYDDNMVFAGYVLRHPWKPDSKFARIYLPEKHAVTKLSTLLYHCEYPGLGDVFYSLDDALSAYGRLPESDRQEGQIWALEIERERLQWMAKQHKNTHRFVYVFEESLTPPMQSTYMGYDVTDYWGGSVLNTIPADEQLYDEWREKFPVRNKLGLLETYEEAVVYRNWMDKLFNWDGESLIENGHAPCLVYRLSRVELSHEDRK